MAQNSKVPATNVSVYYSDSIQGSEGKKRIQDSVFINFLSEFNEETEVLINDKLLLKAKLFTNESTSYTGKSVIWKTKEYKTFTFFKVRLLESKKCLDFIIDPRYKSLDIYYSGNKWTLIYRDKPMQLE